MTTSGNFLLSALAHDLLLFCSAVLFGTAAGVAAQQLLLHVVSPQIATTASLALATTSTGAAHSRFVHGRRIAELIPSVLAGAPVAYAAMRAVHFLAGF